MEVKLQGDYINPSGYTADDTEYLTPELLMKFLISHVSSITQFQSVPCVDPEAKKKKQKLVFSGLFKLRSADSWEEFIFDLKHWPLGVQNLICCET